MSIACHDGSWKCPNTSAETLPVNFETQEETVKDFSCNNVLEESSQAAAMRRKKRQMEHEWRKHLQRLKKLSKPKRHFYENPPVKGPVTPIKTLLPRLLQLAQPKHVTPKYMKPKEEPFQLPGNIRDWESHKCWLAERSQPRRDFTKFYEELCKPKISYEGMRRIHRLAKPRVRSERWKTRPTSMKVHHRMCGMTSTRIRKLRRPKKKRNDFDLDNQPKVSKSATAYQGSQRIKSISLPKHKKLHKKHGVRIHKNSRKCFCCYSSISCENFDSMLVNVFLKSV